MALDTQQYDRGARLSVLPAIPGAPPIVINPVLPPGAGLPSTPQIRIVFSVQKSVTPEPDRVSVTAWNLARTTRNLAAAGAKRVIDISSPSALAKPVNARFTPGDGIAIDLEAQRPHILLEAGYGNAPGLIFSGSNVKCRHRRRGPDWATVFSGGDGELSSSQGVVNESFEIGTPSKAVLVAAAKAMGLVVVPTAGAALLEPFLCTNGCALDGLARDAVTDLLSPLADKLTYFIDNGQLWILENSEFVPGAPVVVTSEAQAGSVQLLEAPEPIDQNGVIIRCMLAPQLKRGGAVTIASREVSGTFRCEDLTHVGDNRTGPFRTTATLRLAGLQL